MKKSVMLFVGLLSAANICLAQPERASLEDQVDSVISACEAREVFSPQNKKYINYALIAGESLLVYGGVKMIRFGWGKPSNSHEDLVSLTGSTVITAAIASHVAQRNATLLANLDTDQLRALAVEFLTGAGGLQTEKIKIECKRAYRAGLNIDCNKVIATLYEKVRSAEICRESEFVDTMKKEIEPR